MLPLLRPNILVVSSNAPLQARISAQLAARYEPVVGRDAGRRRKIALAIIDENDWIPGDEQAMPCPIIIVRTRGKGSAPRADASVRAEFEPAELAERIETNLELARLRSNAATKESVLVDQAGQARERLTFLITAAEKMSNSLSLAETLGHLSEAAVPRLAQWCTITLRENERLTVPVFAHETPVKAALLQELARLNFHAGDRRHPVHRALASGRPEFVAKAPESFVARLGGCARQAELLRELGVGAFMCVPLRSRGKTLGAMMLGADAGWRPLSRADLTLAEELATRAGAAIERARLHQEVENELAERRRAEAALRRNEAEQAMILNTVRAMIWYKDASNRILRCNRAAARWAGKSVPEIEGRRAEELFPAAIARRFHNSDLSVIASGQPRIGELEEINLRRGAKCWVQRDTFPYRDESGSIVGVVIISVDVTKRKRAEDLAVAKERAEREFVANVSHEFRTPVAAIKGFAQTLREGAWRDAAERGRFLDIIEANADRLDSMVGDLLTLSELEGSAPLRSGAAFLSRAARDCAENLMARAKRKRLSVDVSVPQGLRVRMDGARLTQTLENLLDNAIKFTPRGGRVRLTAKSAKGEARITIADTGIGIPQAELPRVFDRFFRVAKGAQAGSPGLGLHLVKKLVEAYGGRVFARSRLARGSVFCVILPSAGRAPRKKGRCRTSERRR